MAYATEEIGSEQNTGNAIHFGSSCAPWASLRNARPISNRLSGSTTKVTGTAYGPAHLARPDPGRAASKIMKTWRKDSVRAGIGGTPAVAGCPLSATVLLTVRDLNRRDTQSESPTPTFDDGVLMGIDQRVLDGDLGS